jgi:hypothetical protein
VGGDYDNGESIQRSLNREDGTRRVWSSRSLRLIYVRLRLWLPKSEVPSQPSVIMSI